MDSFEDNEWESESSRSCFDSDDSDREIQRAFEKGELKPGLHTLESSDPRFQRKTEFKNNLVLLSQRLDELTNDLPWIERLDLVCDNAPLAPELAQQITEHEKRRENQLQQDAARLRKKRKGQRRRLDAFVAASIEDDPVHNDFKRELLFYRLAQSGVMEGLKRLKEAGIKTKRPDDYYAEMLKKDDHMQKVRKVLLQKKTSTELSEKARKFREQRKLNKQMQLDAEEKKRLEKQKLADAVKKFKRGNKNKLSPGQEDGGESDFDDGDDGGVDLGYERTQLGGDGERRRKPGAGNKGRGGQQRKGQGQGTESGNQSRRDQRASKFKSKMKAKKFGFGGQKKRSKYNTKDSVDMVGGRKGSKGGWKGGSAKKGKKHVRPGKSKRMAAKNRRR